MKNDQKLFLNCTKQTIDEVEISGDYHIVNYSDLYPRKKSPYPQSKIRMVNILEIVYLSLTMSMYIIHKNIIKRE